MLITLTYQSKKESVLIKRNNATPNGDRGRICDSLNCPPSSFTHIKYTHLNKTYLWVQLLTPWISSLYLASLKKWNFLILKNIKMYSSPGGGKGTLHNFEDVRENKIFSWTFLELNLLFLTSSRDFSLCIIISCI